MFICLYLFRGFFRDWEQLHNRTLYHVVGSWIIHRLAMVFSAVVFAARAWHMVVFLIRSCATITLIGLALWLEQLPPQLHAILAQILRHQNWGIKEYQRCELMNRQSAKRYTTFNSHGHSTEGTKRERVVRKSTGNPVDHVWMDVGV